MKTTGSISSIGLQKAAAWMKATFSGEDKSFAGVAIDSRTVAENELFFALIGEKSNGHHFIEEVERRGAAGIVVSQTVNSTLPKLCVEDVGNALGKLAQEYRKQFNIPMAAITGSYGKTTVKEMVASILAVEGAVLANQGNFNTEIGLPLTLLRLTNEHQYAVVEMGARKKGDIHYLMGLAEPSVALINNAGIAHIEIFGSELAVRNAKGELYAGLRPDGIAVINAEDPHVDYWKSLLRGQTVFTFGYGSNVNLSISKVDLDLQGSHFILHYQGQMLPIQLNTPGEHNVLNGVAAAATALAMGASFASVQKGLDQFQPVKGRLQFKKGLRDIQLIDDTYNANPVSMRAALSVLATQPGEKWFVMGDMIELGDHAETWHRDIGKEAKRLGIHKMFGIGKMTKNALLEFGAQGHHYNDKDNLISEVKHELQASPKNLTILVKGARAMRMEEVVIALQNSEDIPKSDNISKDVKENRAC